MNIKIAGKVIKGDGYGKALGFPTANIDRRNFVRQKLKIKLGVYAGFVTINDYKLPLPSPSQLGEGIKKSPLVVSSLLRGEVRRGWYRAGIVIGPLDKKGLPKIEAHLIGFSGNLYGSYLNIYLNSYLRGWKKFKHENELKLQIQKDIKKVKKIIYE